MIGPDEEEEKLPRDFDLPEEDIDSEEIENSQTVQDILVGSMNPPPGGAHISPEDFLVLSSTITLYAGYVAYVKEMDELLHRRAIDYAAETSDLHPNVVLTDTDGNPIGRLDADVSSEDEEKDDEDYGV